MAAIETFENIQAIFDLIDELSEKEQNALYRTALDAHMKDPFHDITQCERCKRQDPKRSYGDHMCSGCGCCEDDHEYWITYKCEACFKVFDTCHECTKNPRMFQPFDCGSDGLWHTCVCNWCAAKSPERIECPYIDDSNHNREGRCDAIQNRHYNQPLIKCATKV